MTERAIFLLNRLISVAVAAIFFCVSSSAYAEITNKNAPESSDHPSNIRITAVDYSLPNVKLLRDDDKKVTLNEELNDGRPVFVNFVYTTCTTFCPVLSHTFSQLQKKLGVEANKVHLVSFSIDPERDTPSRLREYANKYKAGPYWNHYTSSIEDSIAIQQAFDVYRGDKMNHPPVALLRMAPNKPWLRFDGFANADDLLAEYRKQLTSK